MAKCIVKGCKSSGCDLFCSPEDKTKLRKWKNILKTEEKNFLICCVHFESRFLGSEKFLTQDAYPTVLIDGGISLDTACLSCLKIYDGGEFKSPLTKQILEIFTTATGFKVKLSGL